MGHSFWQCCLDDSQVSELQHGLIQLQHWRSSRATLVLALLAIPALLWLVGVQERGDSRAAATRPTSKLATRVNLMVDARRVSLSGRIRQDAVAS